MIDSHSHTFYSKHAVGTVDELVRASIVAGVKILTITDHAPFPVDSDNRLLEAELECYFADIERARQEHQGQITILRGLEFDYMPGSDAYNRDLLDRFELDFAIGSIHYVELPDEPMAKVWELPRLASAGFLDRYFAHLQALLECGLFDAVGHADTLLRGVAEDVVLRRMEPLLPLFARNGVAYELNASGIRKSSLLPGSTHEVKGVWNYPSRTLLPQLIAHGAAFTIGSDAHDPLDAGAGISTLVDELYPLGLKWISYFEDRRRIEMPLDFFSLSSGIHTRTAP